MTEGENGRLKVVFFTGAGVSAESGIPTFRDRLGLWNIDDPMTIASKSAWKTNRENVLEFHNRLRKTVKDSEPNSAHRLMADLENLYEVTVITQNVDDLHERAGSTNIVHLHGKIMQARSTLNPSIVLDWDKDILESDKCPRGSQLRPNVVWFGEPLDEKDIDKSVTIVKDCDVMVVVGTSLNVEPASSVVDLLQNHQSLIVVDPNAETLEITRQYNVTLLGLSATVGMVEVAEVLKKYCNR